jgi:hypothetical protein
MIHGGKLVTVDDVEQVRAVRQSDDVGRDSEGDGEVDE